jgi:hypothetical protein
MDLTEPEAERELAELLAGAGRRPEMPAAARVEVEAAARAAWNELVARQRQRQRFVPREATRWLVAAAALVAVAIGLWRAQRPARDPAPSPVPLATVEIVRGEARRVAARDGGRALTHGESVVAGEVTETGANAAAAFRVAGGTSLRVDAASRVVWLAPARLRLERGALYVDSAPGSGAAAIAVETAFATVVEIGTQFEVRLTDTPAEPLRVRVREGSVELRENGQLAGAAAGEELGLAKDGSIRRAPIATYGDLWSWVATVAPEFEIEGRTLAAFLEWAARETGWRVELEGDGLAAAAATIRLHGSIAGMTPGEAMSVVLPGSGLDYRLADGVLTVARAPRR